MDLCDTAFRQVKKSRTIPGDHASTRSDTACATIDNMIPGTGELHQLPCHVTGADAIKRITSETVVRLMDGGFDDICDEYYIIDNRFPYEYDGGHIEKAINVNTVSGLEEMFLENIQTHKRLILIFHCEFSSMRAPKMALHLRKQDRNMNYSRYPQLFYPEIYILKGGYKEFFSQYPNRCNPQNYVQMHDIKYVQELRREVKERKISFERSKSYSEVPFFSSFPCSSKQPQHQSAPPSAIRSGSFGKTTIQTQNIGKPTLFSASVANDFVENATAKVQAQAQAQSLEGEQEEEYQKHNPLIQLHFDDEMIL